MILYVTIAGPPTSWKRARLGEAGNRGRFTPKAMKQAKLILRNCVAVARAEMEHETRRRWPLDAAYRLEVDFYRRRKVTATPDLDNLVKLPMDACNGVLWNDDAQVVVMRAQKYDVRETEDDDRERTEMRVWVLA